MDYLTRHGQRLTDALKRKAELILENASQLDMLRNRFRIVHEGYTLMKIGIDNEGSDHVLGYSDVSGMWVVADDYILNSCQYWACGRYFGSLEEAERFYTLRDSWREPREDSTYSITDVWMSKEWRSKGFN